MIPTIQLYENAIVGSDQKLLNDIHLPAKNIAIYERDITVLNEELTRLMTEYVDCQTKGTVAEIITYVSDYFAQNFADCTALLADIISLVELFEKTTKATSLRLLLTTVETNMCRKFHTDINDLRMLCTYVGPGTLWLPDEAVDYQALKRRASDQEVIKEKAQIQQVGTGNIVLLKGALYGNANPILHRSPSIEQRGEKRLLLRIDTNKFLNIWK
ncbi:MAG: DUF1826 domain-containing protein [Bacteroidota bacterium]